MDERIEPAAAAPGDGPLSGVRVLDCATILAGPLCAQLLGDFGADVIKIEDPDGGDGLRGHGPAKDSVPLWWSMVGRNKRTVGLDLSSTDGADLFLRLAAGADVLVESFRPGTLERWSIGPDRLLEVNPELVIVRVSGFGQDGPYSRRPAFGTLIEAMSGFAAMTGGPDADPVLPPFGLADGVAGIAAALAAVMALHHRSGGGGGQVVDLAILEPLLTVLGPQPLTFDQLGRKPQRLGNRSAYNAPRNTYRTGDGKWVAISTSALAVAKRVMEIVGRPDLADEPWFATGAGRVAHVDELDKAVGAWIAEHTLAEVTESFDRAQAAVAPIYDVEALLDDPQVRFRDAVTTVVDDRLGPVRMQNVLFRMSKTPGRIRFTGRPRGADTDVVLTEQLGLDGRTIGSLRERDIVG